MMVPSKRLILLSLIMLATVQFFMLMGNVVAPAGFTVDAGPDQVVLSGTPVTLNGTVDFFAIPYDPPFTYEWQFGDGSLPAVGTIAGDVTQVTHNYVGGFAYVAQFTVTAMDQAGNPVNASDTCLIAVYIQPTIETYDDAGNRKDVFAYLEGITLLGSGYLPSFNPPTFRYWIYVLNDTNWVDGMAIPTEIGRMGVVSTSAGNLETALIPYHWYLAPGGYDLLVDVDDDGIYDAGLDALDDMDVTGAGFLVIPELWLGSILGLAGCFAAFGVFLATKRKRS